MEVREAEHHISQLTPGSRPDNLSALRKVTGEIQPQFEEHSFF